jgi:hypothetical protein
VSISPPHICPKWIGPAESTISEWTDKRVFRRRGRNNPFERRSKQGTWRT